VYIFTQVAGPEMESFGRIGSGIGELVAAVLILIPKTRVYGAVLSAIVILGAIFSHLTILGVVVLDDGGTLFILACIVLVLSAALVLIHRSDLPLKSSS
ncbi:MAG: DoxX family protein, partial [Pyrinomonadaceae bacterium]|nr:DoxX family protein [Pyrinomonadaceae bacterium]